MKSSSLAEDFKNSSLVTFLDRLDKRASGFIHHLELPNFLQIIIAFFATLCNKEGPLAIMAIVGIVLPRFEDQRKPYFVIYYGLQYFATGMTALVWVVILKKFWRRPRPRPPSGVRRLYNLRGKEIDCSWPSGDTAQAAVLSAYLTVNMPFVVERIPCGHLTLALFVALVALGRVYYHCHFIGDTLGGAFLGAVCVLVNAGLTRLLV